MILQPILWALLILVISQALTLYVALQEKKFIEEQQIVPPEVSLEIPIAYFFGVVVLFGLILFLVPVAKLKLVFKFLYTFLFCWGIFIVLGLTLPWTVAAAISIVAGLAWFFSPRVWLHNLLLILTLVGVGSVFGLFLSPWTAMAFMLVISVYDILAVRFGYMMWMAKKLSEIETLPAFVIPKTGTDWNFNLKRGFKKVLEEKPSEREFSILGGGDIGFPLFLIVSVFFAYGWTSSLVIAAFSLIGLICAYLIQLFFLKGKPVPAMPPISFFSLIGLLIVYL